MFEPIHGSVPKIADKGVARWFAAGIGGGELRTVPEASIDYSMTG